MCGRFTHRYSWEELVKLYRLTLPAVPPNALRPTWNAAPTQDLPIIRPLEDGGRELLLAGWGLIPFWSKDAKRSYSTINARSETLREKATYKQSFERRRCIVPMSGWYEWQVIGPKEKQPIFMHASAEPVAFAGMWDTWKRDAAESLTSFAIATTMPAGSVAAYHDRMPVVLDEAQFDVWMRGTPDEAAALLAPYSGAIEAWPVAKAVGNVRNNGPELLQRAAA